MRAFLLLLSTTLAVPAFAQDNAQDAQTVVVTGTPLRETAKRLADCIARKCPPKEDIDASLAHAENQLVAGDYAGGRRTLGKARGRNRQFANVFPLEVSDLDRAYGRMSNLNGRPDAGRLAQIESLEALRAGLDAGDSRIFMQQIMIGDEFARAGKYRAATDVYEKVAKQARKAGDLRATGFAMMREALLYSALARAVSGYSKEAERQIAKIERTQELDLAPFRDAAKLLRTKVAAISGDQKELARKIAAIPPQASGRPTLIYAPPIVSEEMLPTENDTSGNGDPEWIDIRFRVAADGSVHDVETLRDSGNVGGTWPKLVYLSISGRRYAPLALQPGSAGPARIERFSYVHDLVWRTGSRVPERIIRGRITSLDLTTDPAQS